MNEKNKIPEKHEQSANPEKHEQSANPEKHEEMNVCMKFSPVT
jgi:hypothetical protein